MTAACEASTADPAARIYTGPITEQGKAASRLNARTGGLSSRSLLVPIHLAEQIEEQERGLRASLGVKCTDDTFINIQIRTIAIEGLRIERCRQKEMLAREAVSWDSNYSWNETQAIRVRKAALKLRQQPEIVARELELSRYGLDWMIERWNYLAARAEKSGTWTGDDLYHAFDLRGIDSSRRDLEAPSGPDDCRRIAQSEIERLRALIPLGICFDQERRNETLFGVSPEIEARIKLLRRYETASRRAMDNALKELRQYQADKTASAPASEPRAPRYETNSPPAEADPSDDEILEQYAAYLNVSKPEAPAPYAARTSARPQTKSRNRKERRADLARARKA